MSGNEPNDFDQEVLDSLREAIGDKVNRIVEVYLADAPKNIETMRKALESLEYETLGRLSHSLKSSSANIGAMQISILAANLEKFIKDGNVDQDFMQHSIDNIQESFNKIRTMLINYIG